jgi:4-amino-4-deoxy-L-arabinose transferase-like glycosyltransferase
MLLSVSQMSQQTDETTHLYAGYRALKCGDYTFGREHPPLAKMIAAAPLLWSNPPIDCAGSAGVEEADQAIRWLYSQNNWWHLLMEARAAASLSAVALCLGVWVTARRMFGRAVAVVSTTVLAFEPNILGHGALVTNNVLLAALFLLTVFCFYLWTRSRSEPLLLVGTGFVLGLTLLTKHPAALLLPILILLAVAEAWMENSDPAARARSMLRNLGAVAAILAIAAATIWCGYGMRYSGGPRRASDSMPQEQIAKMNSLDVRILKAMRAGHLMPQPYLDGLIETRGLVTTGLESYILGRYYPEAPWFFYPLTTTIKFTVPFLAILILGVVGIVAIGRQRRTELLFLLLPALLFLAASTRVKRTSGIWHMFPLLPFLLIAGAAGCVYLARRYRGASGALVCLLVLHSVSSLRAYPNYISYANESWGGPQNLYKYLPWTDGGQAYWQVSRYMEQHPNTPCWVDSNFYTPLDAYKIPCQRIGTVDAAPLPERMKGIVIVSTSALEIEGQPGSPLAPFYMSKPKDHLGGSAMLVYEGEFDTRLLAARALVNNALGFLVSSDPMAALVPAKKAVELGPSAAFPHLAYCIALANNGYVQQSLLECSVALKLAKASPPGSPSTEAITQVMASISRQSGLPLPQEGQ